MKYSTYRVSKLKLKLLSFIDSLTLPNHKYWSNKLSDMRDVIVFGLGQVNNCSCGYPPIVFIDNSLDFVSIECGHCCKCEVLKVKEYIKSYQN